MRHGYEWWEAFWKWLETTYHYPVHLRWDDIPGWLKEKKKEFEELWREGKVQISP